MGSNTPSCVKYRLAASINRLMPKSRFPYPKLQLVLVVAGMLALACAAIVAIGRLQADATGARDAQLKLVSLRLDLAQIQQVPWGAAPGEGDSLDDVKGELQGDQEEIQKTLDELSRGGGLRDPAQVEVPFKLTTGALWEILRLVSKDRSDQANEASDLAARQAAKADLALQRAAEHDRGRSVQSLRHARIGSAAVILLLFLAFAWFYLRALRARRTAETLAAENRRLLAASQAEALTDPLTGLGNRRALMADLEARPEPAEGEQTLLALFDLDGFKHYNDTFGHPAGDAVLQLLGGRLADAVTSCGSAYRMGGDEFCVVASVQEDAAEDVAILGASALTENGVGFSIVSSYGTALMPAEAGTASDALRLADQRMYKHKHAARALAGRGSSAA
jgi:diguanylate cyclase (GGDEF)-like protein